MIRHFLFDTFAFFIAGALLSAILTAVALKALRRRAILDLPNARSSHSVPTPRGGGWGVMLALLPLWIWATAAAGRLHDPAELLVLAGAALLMAVSWIDDRRALGAGVRIAAQAVAAGAVMAMLPTNLSLSGGLLPVVLDRIVALLIWLWFVNLFNFMDGIDGLAGGSAAAMGFGVMIAALRFGPDQLEAFRGAMIAAVGCGFLYWNWQPAKIFLGDVGSIPIGYLLGYELLHLAMNGARIVALIIPLYYLADASITLCRRALRRERVWQAHREHFYQRSVQLGRSHARTAEAAILAQLALAIFASLAAAGNWWMIVIAIALVGLLLRWMNRPPRSV